MQQVIAQEADIKEITIQEAETVVGGTAGSIWIASVGGTADSIWLGSVGATLPFCSIRHDPNPGHCNFS